MLRFVAGLLIGGALTWLVTQEASPAVATSARSPVASTAAPSPTSLEAALAVARRTGKAVPIPLVYTEQQLTDFAVAGMPRSYSGINLSDPRVRLQTGVVVFTANAQWGFISGSLQTIAVPQASNGRPILNMTSATIAGISLPDSIRQSIEQELQRQLDAAVPSNLQVTGITVANGTLAVQALVSP
ncbi:MAG TPA: hypothetical protein VHG53_06940 [Candidatus Limnocylindria bacterium]|nr:hypothetical protein [Candidatus Limnocylindria bacterium]